MLETTNFSEAVRHAIKVVGYQSKLETLVREAYKYYAYEIDLDDPEELQRLKNMASQARTNWQKKNKRHADCRTYEGQPDRDMPLHEGVTADMVGECCKFVSEVGHEKTAEFVGRFNSLRQLQTFLDHVKTGTALGLGIITMD